MPQPEAEVKAAGPLKLRVLIYGMNFAPEIAGVGKFTGDIAEHLSQSGHDVAVVTTAGHYPGWRYMPGEAGGWRTERLKGALVYRCPLYLSSKMSGIRRIFAPASFALSSIIPFIVAALRQRSTHIIVVEPTILVAPLALVVAQILGAKSILHVQDLEIDAAFALKHVKAGRGAAAVVLRLEARLLSFFGHIITISNVMAQRIVSKGVRPEAISVIRNWVDLFQIRAEGDGGAYRSELNIPADAFVAMYSGNLGAKQDISTVLGAIKLLSNNLNIHFVIAGDGPMRQIVMDAAQANPRLHLLALQPERRFSEFLRMADLHLLPQERNAADLMLPSKLGGLLASGRPVVVTTDHGTELDTFLNGSAVLVPPGEPRMLAEAIISQSRSLNDDLLDVRLELAKSLARTTLLPRFEQLLTYAC